MIAHCPRSEVSIIAIAQLGTPDIIAHLKATVISEQNAGAVFGASQTVCKSHYLLCCPCGTS